MIQAQASKFQQLVVPAAIVDNASFTTLVIDTVDATTGQKWDYATIVVQLGATDIAMTALAVKESDDNSTNTNVTGTVFGTAVDIDGTTTVLPASTDDNKVEVIHLDLRKRKRYLQLLATAGDGTTGTYLSALCILSRGSVAPDSCAEMGAEHALIV
jgi:hypothetical protein